MSPEQLVAICLQTGDLSQEQLQRLSDAAPIPVDVE